MIYNLKENKIIYENKMIGNILRISEDEALHSGDLSEFKL
jgi:hypothetical protein